MAEDAAQEVFIEIFRSVSGFNEQSSLSTWVYRITVNKCLDHIRFHKRAKRNATLLPWLVKDEQGIEMPVYDHPGIILERRDDARILFSAIDKLPENQKLAFILLQVQGMSQRETAAIMDVTVKAVEALVQRAKANLRKMLGDIYDERRKKQK